MNANDIQHGGDHYRKAGNNQHWDMLAFCGFGWEYYIGRATAYFSRIKEVELDPSKGCHFIDKLTELATQGRVPSVFQTAQGARINADLGGRSVDVEDYLEKSYFPANSIPSDSDRAEVIRTLMQARTMDDLAHARDVAARVEAAARQRPTAEAASGGDASHAYVSQEGPAGE